MNDNQIIDGALNYLADFVKNYSAMAGTIKMFAGSVAPDGWLLCNGQAVSRTTYSKLFNVIGTTYGEGDGSTTFNVPDLRGRTPVGVGTGTATGATAHALGQKAGAESSSYTPAGTISGTAITQAQLPAISASVNVRNVANASYNMLTSSTGKFTVAEVGDATNAVALGSVQNQIQKLTFSVGKGNPHTHNWTGTAATINKMQPYLAVNYIICTGDDIDLNPSTNPEFRSGSGTVTVPVSASATNLALLATLPVGLWEVKLCVMWPNSAGTINKNFGIYQGTNSGSGTSFYAIPAGSSNSACADSVSRIIKIDGNTASENKNIYLSAWQGSNSDVTDVNYRYTITQLGGVVDRDYDYPIGEIRQTSGTISVASSTTPRVKVDTLPKGVWLVSARVNYADNTTGERSLGIWLTDSVGTGYARIPAAGNSGVTTSVTAHRVIQITQNTVDRDINLGFWQNSGSSLEVTYKYKATQIGGEMIPSYQDPVEYVNDYTMMMNRQLEMSVNPWSSGTCSITGISNYDVIQVIQSGEQPLIGLRRQGASATQAFYYLFSIIPTATAHYTKGGIITTNGDSCSFNRNVASLGHSPSSNHSALSKAEGIIKIIGLIPRHDAIADIQAPLSNPMTDFVISQGSSSETSAGTGTWRWREWNSGKVEIWYNGSISTNIASSQSGGGVYRAARRVPFPNNYALNNCTCILDGSYTGGWIVCGGSFNSSEVGADPRSMVEVMAYRLNSAPGTEGGTSVHMYICGQKNN